MEVSQLSLSMFDSSPQPFCVIKVELGSQGEPVDWTFLYCNDALAALEGYPREKLLGHRFFELFPGGNRKWLQPYYEAAYKNKVSSFASNSDEVEKYLYVDCFPLGEPGICGCMLRTTTQEAEYREELRLSDSPSNLLHTAITTGLWRIEYNKKEEPTQCVWSEAFRVVLGYPRKEDFPETIDAWMEKIHPEDRSAVEAQYSRAVHDHTGKENYDVEYRARNQQGEYHWFRDTGHISRRPDGSPIAIDGVIVLTDEKHQAEEKIRMVQRDKEELQKLLDVEQQCSCLLVALGRVYWQMYSVDLPSRKYYQVSATAEDGVLHYQTGFAPEAFSGALRRFVSDDYRDIMTAFLDHDTVAERLAERDYISQEYFSTIGAWFCASYIAEKRDESGTVTNVLFTLQNVTAQMEKELEQQRQEEQLNRQLKAGNQKLEEQIHIISGLANAYFAVYRVSLPDNRCRAIQDVDLFTQMAQDCNTTDDVIHAFISQCVMPEDMEKMAAFTDQHTLVERMKETDTLVQEFHGAISPWEWCRASWIVADRDSSGNVEDALFTVEDVTAAVSERKKLEAERDQELLAAEAANQAKSAFLFNMSHDIRTPMNAILGFSNLAEKYPEVPETVREYLKKIQISGQGLLSILDNVLELSRIESGKIVLEESAQVAGGVLDACMVMIHPEIEKRHHTVTLSKQLEYPYAYFDATHMTEILLNILSNAVKYTADGGTIRCTLIQHPNPKPGWVDQEFTVTDNGVGMSEEFREHIFESFARERTTTDSGIQGTGLGMGIVKKLVDLMNGTISVQSELGKGTTVSICIPCRIAAFEDTQPKPAEKRADHQRLMGKRVLLAEDNDLNAEIAMTLLGEEGLLTERAANGVECVEMLERKPEGYYDLILMDIQMPALDGYMATQKIRKLADPARAGIPIIAMTANAFSEDRQRALEMGMNDHVAKPVDMNVLTDTMLKYLR